MKFEEHPVKCYDRDITDTVRACTDRDVTDTISPKVLTPLSIFKCYNGDIIVLTHKTLCT